MRRVSAVGLAVLAVIVFAAAIYVVVHTDDPPAQSAGPPVRTASASISAPAPSAPALSASSVVQAKPVVAFLGDDWTSGAAASSPSHRFSTLVSSRLGLVERNFGAAGTGYAKSSGSDGPYSSRVADVVAANPGVVVVSGGRNDVIDDLGTAAAHVRTLFETLHTKLPHATLVAIAPMWGDSDQPAELTTIARAVKDAVTAAGGTYLDLPDPIHGHPELMATAADPTDAGYAAIAAALEPALQPLVTQ